MAPLPKPKRRTKPNNTSLYKQGSASKSSRNSNAVTNSQTDIGTLSVSASNTIHAASSDTASYSALEQLPVEVANHILSYLVQPRSRLPGLTEQESRYDSVRRSTIKRIEDLKSPPDADRFAAHMFPWNTIRHPFNALAASSKHCRGLVESYCSHLVKSHNRFHLPFAEADKHGADSVYPSLSGIVYRRLWLQTAPRPCLFCGVIISSYPHDPRRFGLMLCCADCFYDQTLSLYEVQHQYHILDTSILAAHSVRSVSPRYEWILRTDVEALALQLYGTRAFHDTQSQGLDVPCSIPGCGLNISRLSISSPPRPRMLPSHISSAPRTRRRGH